MKEGWEYRIFESCLVKAPKQVQVKSKDYKKEGIFPIVSQEAELISGYWDDETIVYKHKEPVVIFGDHTKNIKYVDFDFIVGADGTHILSTKKDISPKFFYYVLKSIKLRELGYARHYRLLKEKYIPVPPLSEQQSIVDYLDSAFAKIDAMKANAEKALNEAKALFQASLKEMLEQKEGWEEKTLGDVCAITSLLVNPVEEQYKKLLHVGGANIISESGEFVDLKTADEEGLISGKFVFSNEDVLYNKIRPYLKKVARPDFSGLCSADMYPLRHNQSITRDYLYYVLVTKDFTDYAILNSSRAGMPKVNRQAVFAYNFFLPSLSEQQTIVTTLDTLKSKVDRLQENYNKISQECDALKQAILRQVFE